MKIAVDAGHGLHTAGKRSPDGVLREFHFNSVVAEFVRWGLTALTTAAGGEIEVLYTHDKTGAIDVPLIERTNPANVGN